MSLTSKPYIAIDGWCKNRRQRRVRSRQGLVNSHQVNWTWNLSIGVWSNSWHWRRHEVKLNSGLNARGSVIGLFLCWGRQKEKATLSEVLCTPCRLPSPIREWQTDVHSARRCQTPVMKDTSALEKAQDEGGGRQPAEQRHKHISGLMSEMQRHREAENNVL